MSTNVGEVDLYLRLNTSDFNKILNNTANLAEGKMSQTLGNITSFVGKAFAVGAVVKFGKVAVDTASQAQSAWTGLNSIVSGQGRSFKEAESFLNGYINDGLVPLNNAVTSYKNLVSRGYDTSQIEQIMDVFKNTAAFGRQSSYTMGEAIQGATEGLKNENSILVDNVGVTKNVAKMWDEYARSIGTTSNNLTLAQKRQAEVNGILEESKFQMGDAQAYTNTFAGRMAQLTTAFTNVKIAVGNVIAPIAQMFIPVLTGALNAVTRFFNGIGQILSVLGIKFPKVISNGTKPALDSISSGVGKATDSMGSAGKQAKKTAKEINRAFASVDELNVINLPDKSDSASSGGSGGSGSGGGASEESPLTLEPNVDTDGIESVTPEIQEIVDTIKGLIGQINFEPIKNGFKVFGQGISDTWNNLIKPVVEVLFFDFLYPLSKFVIEDTLPRFLTATGKALSEIDFSNFISGFEEFVEPLEKIGEFILDGGMTIYEKLILPIAKTTISNVIPSVFFAIGQALKVISAIWEDVKPFFDFLVEIAGKISTAILEGIGTALKDIGDTLKIIAENEVVISILEGIIITLGGLAVALALANIAIIVYNGAMTFATAVTGAFTTVMAVLTSPITLVIAAIALLVAGIILLVKNWDTVKEASINTWNGIVQAWQGVGEWFNNIVIKPTKEFFESFWEGTKQVSINAWDGIKNIWQVVSDWFNNTIISPISNLFRMVWDGIKNGASNAWNGIKSMWQGIASWFNSTVVDPIRNAFNRVGEAVFSVFNGIKGTIQSTISSMPGFIKAPINGIIANINRVIGRVNSMKVPDWVPGIGGSKVNLPEIPMLAQGGYVKANNPQLAIIGDNKREGEIVAPESKLEEALTRALDKKGNVYNGSMEIILKVEYEDGRTIIKKINKTQEEEGRVLLDV